MKKLIFMFPITAGILWGSVGVFVRTLSNFGINNYTILSSKVMAAAILLLIGVIILLPLTDWNILEKYVVAAPIENSLILLFHSLCTSVFS